MRRVTAGRLLLAGTGVLFVARLVLSLVRTGPVVVADEVGYVTNARVLAGGVSGQMRDAPFYRGGYSLLLTPLVGVIHSPEAAYRGVLVLNAALAASVAPLLFLLLTRHFGVSPRSAVWAALAAAAYPTVTVLSQVALSENLLFPGVVVWLLCWGALLDAPGGRRRLAWSAALGACTIALFSIHGRMIVAVGVTVAAAILLAIRRRIELQAAAIAVAVIAIGYVPVRVLNHFLMSRSWGGHAPDEVGNRLAGAGTAHGLAGLARNLVGQTWYVVVATLGVVLAFGIGSWRRELLTLRRRDAATSAKLLALLLAMLAGLLVVSALSFHEVERPDMLVYGRYVEVVLPPILAIGLARLSAGALPRIAPVVGTVVAATAFVVLLRETIDPARPTNGWNIASFPFVMRNLGPLPLIGAGAAACAAFSVAILVARRRPAFLAPAVLLLFVPTTAAAEHKPVLSGQDAFYGNGWTSPGDAAPRARVVGYDVDHPQGLYVDQWFMRHAHFVLFSGSSDVVPSSYVISAPTWARLHGRLQPKELWHDTASEHGLFRVSP